MTAMTMQGLATTHRTPMAVSALAHMLLLIALGSSVNFVTEQPLQPLAIEAVVVDEGRQRRAAAAERQRQQVEAERAAERRRQLEAEQRRRDELAAQQRQAAERARAEAEQRRLQEEQARVRAEQQRREAEAAAQRERERREAEAAVQRERERKAAEERARAEAERRAQEQREAELAAMLAEEEALAEARGSAAMSRYVALIAQKVERNWVQPASAVPGVECEVSVQQLPGGTVVSARVTRCNGDEQVRRSVETAVLAASPLPQPDDPRLFDRNLKFTFRPLVAN